MKPTKKYTFTIGALGVYRLQVSGDYFKILAADGAVKVNSNDWGELRGLTVGQGLENANFSDLFFTDESGASNTVTVYVGDRNFIDGVTGDVRITNQPTVDVGNMPASNGTFNQSAGTATTASAQFRAANANRRYLMVQNKSATGTIWVNLTGVAATQANGIKLIPGGSLELQGYVPTDAVMIIGDIASNPDVLIVEG